MVNAGQYKGQRLIRLAAVEEILGHKKTWIYKHIKAGNIPAPAKPSLYDAVWNEADILAVKDKLLNGTFGQKEAATA